MFGISKKVRIFAPCSMKNKNNKEIDGGVLPMRRWNFFIEQKWLERLERDKAEHGFRTTASFIRYIVISFFKNIDKQAERR